MAGAAGFDVLRLFSHLRGSGRQYVAVVAGYSRNSLAPEIDNVTGDNMVYVFALPEVPTGQEINRPNAKN